MKIQVKKNITQTPTTTINKNLFNWRIDCMITKRLHLNFTFRFEFCCSFVFIYIMLKSDNKGVFDIYGGSNNEEFFVGNEETSVANEQDNIFCNPYM